MPSVARQRAKQNHGLLLQNRWGNRYASTFNPDARLFNQVAF
jgi:hypothetical protein